MATNNPVKRGTRQTEERARGLVGWKNGRQVTNSKDAVANKNVGDYKARKGKSGKTLNLTNKQLGASGRKAASAATVDISKTTFDKSKGGVLGPKGKPLTGRVNLGGGNIAVYKNGVRVRAGSGGSGGGGGGGGGGGPVVDKRRSRITDRGPALQAERNPRAKPYITDRGPALQAERNPGAKYMAQPYRPGQTRPLPGFTKFERDINNKNRPYPSRASKAESDRINRNAATAALIGASLIPGVGVGVRAVQGVRMAAAISKAAGASRAASKLTPAQKGARTRAANRKASLEQNASKKKG